MLHKSAKFHAFFLFPRHKGINRTSGGIGKKKASENERIEIE